MIKVRGSAKDIPQRIYYWKGKDARKYVYWERIDGECIEFEIDENGSRTTVQS